MSNMRETKITKRALKSKEKTFLFQSFAFVCSFFLHCFLFLISVFLPCIFLYLSSPMCLNITSCHLRDGKGWFTLNCKLCELVFVGKCTRLPACKYMQTIKCQVHPWQECFCPAPPFVMQFNISLPFIWL